jgi:hypothetical protein
MKSSSSEKSSEGRKAQVKYDGLEEDAKSCSSIDNHHGPRDNFEMKNQYQEATEHWSEQDVPHVKDSMAKPSSTSERLLSIGNELAQEPNQNSTFQNTAVQKFNAVGFELFPDDDDDKAEVEDDDEDERGEDGDEGRQEEEANGQEQQQQQEHEHEQQQEHEHEQEHAQEQEHEKGQAPEAGCEIEERKDWMKEDLNQRTKTKVSGYHQGRDSDLERQDSCGNVEDLFNQEEGLCQEDMDAREFGRMMEQEVAKAIETEKASAKVPDSQSFPSSRCKKGLKDVAGKKFSELSISTTKAKRKIKSLTIRVPRDCNTTLVDLKDLRSKVIRSVYASGNLHRSGKTASSSSLLNEKLYAMQKEAENDGLPIESMRAKTFCDWIVSLHGMTSEDATTLVDVFRDYRYYSMTLTLPLPLVNVRLFSTFLRSKSIKLKKMSKTRSRLAVEEGMRGNVVIVRRARVLRPSGDFAQYGRTQPAMVLAKFGAVPRQETKESELAAASLASFVSVGAIATNTAPSRIVIEAQLQEMDGTEGRRLRLLLRITGGAPTDTRKVREMLSSLVDRLLYVDGRIKIGPPVKSSSKFLHSPRSKMSQKKHVQRVQSPRSKKDKMRANASGSARDSTDTNRSVEMVNGVRMAQQLAEAEALRQRSNGLLQTLRGKIEAVRGVEISGTAEEEASRRMKIQSDKAAEAMTEAERAVAEALAGLGDPGADFF